MPKIASFCRRGKEKVKKGNVVLSKIDPKKEPFPFPKDKLYGGMIQGCFQFICPVCHEVLSKGINIIENDHNGRIVANIQCQHCNKVYDLKIHTTD